MLQFIHIFPAHIWYTEDTKRRDVFMLEILTIVVFCWLSFKLLGLFFRMAWGAAKLIASILFVIALPLLVLCLIFAGGMLLLIPLGLLALAFGILKACV